MSSKNDKKDCNIAVNIWPQFALLEKILENKLVERGEKPIMANMATLLGVSLSKIERWKGGQWPTRDDLQLLAQTLGLSCEWLLLGTGEPFYQPKTPDKFNPDYVHICDTLHDLLSQLPDMPPTVATIGGLRLEELNACLSSTALPPLTAVARWIHHYKLNANFLLAQIGQPFLTEDEYLAQGPLDHVRERRKDRTRHTSPKDDSDLNFADGRKPPKGPSAETELVYMVNEYMLKTRDSARAAEREVDLATARLKQELAQKDETIYSLTKMLEKAKGDKPSSKSLGETNGGGVRDAPDRAKHRVAGTSGE